MLWDGNCPRLFSRCTSALPGCHGRNTPATIMSAIEITQEQRDQIKKRQVANALAKLNAGGSLSAREQALLDEITEFDPSRRANRFSISELAILTGKAPR